MQAAIPGVVRFKDHAAAELTLKADVGLIALRNAQAGIETTQNSATRSAGAGILNCELFDQRRVSGERLRKAKIGRDEGATLRVGQDLSRRDIGERVGIEK